MKYKRDFEVPDEYEERYSEEEKIKQAQIKRINENNTPFVSHTAE